jgi:hypothetical protein
LEYKDNLFLIAALPPRGPSPLWVLRRVVGGRRCH